MSSTTAAAPSGVERTRAAVQRFGTFLSGMIMPNIGALIAWGLITAFFIEVGFTPVGVIGGFGQSEIGGEMVDNVGLVGPMITYLLPLLIGYQGGRMMYESHATRGGVIGAVATMGVIIGVPNSPMFLGAMIMGPLGGWTMKKIDSIWDGKIKPGFEMLVNNFAAGIWGMLIALFGLFAISPIVRAITVGLGNVVQFLVDNHLLPLTSILIEPAKVMFLNNAINHGVLTPLGLAQAAGPAHKSVLFLLEANPGPGLGILLAFMVAGKGMARASAPGAALIHFFGGIHEIYFPYVLMKPALLLAVIGGGMTGVATNVAFDTGLRAPAAPGSIIAIMIQCASDSYLGVILSVVLATAVSFVIGFFILKADRRPEMDSEDDSLQAATAQMEAMKGKKSVASGAIATITPPIGKITDIVFACDAGMGSSAMGASVLRNKIHEAGFGDIKVTNESIANLKDNYQIVVTHQDLAARAAPKVPSAALVTVDNFMMSPRYDEVVEMIRLERSGEVLTPQAPVEAAPAAPAAEATDSGILDPSSIVLTGSATSRDDAITEAGNLLVARGAVTSGYVDAMHEREKSVSTYMGSLLAIPHGTNDAKQYISDSAMSFIRYDKPIDWNGKEVRFVVGIAGKGNEHLAILGRIAKVFSNKEKVDALEKASTPQEILDVLGSVLA